MELHPTLWRSCRVLAGPTRLRLLKLVLHEPGLTVSDLAAQTDISLSRASQELRRLNSRGLLQARRQGREVRYVPETDPQVPDAKPILEAVHKAVRSAQPKTLPRMAEIATAFSHPRRIAILCALSRSTGEAWELSRSLGLPLRAVHRHVAVLCSLAITTTQDGLYALRPTSHPLTGCLLALARRHAEGP